MYDINDRESFNNVDKWAKEIRDIQRNDIFLFLVGNKLDIGNREVSQEEALAKAKELQCSCIETSAKENINIVELFNKLTEKLLTKDLHKQDDIETIHIDPKEKESSGCC